MSEEVQTPETPVIEQTPNQPVVAPRMINDDGRFTQEFRDSLPDELGKHSSFDKYEKATDYFKGAINSAKLNGQKMEDFWASEDPAHVLKKAEIMGIPSSITEYEYENVEMPAGISPEVITSRVESMKEKFKEIGINKTQAKALIEMDLQSIVSNFNTQEEASVVSMQESEDALRAEWKGEKFNYNIDKTKNAIKYLNGEDLINNPVYGNDPKFIKWANENIVPLISNDTMIEARQVQTESTLKDSLDSIDTKIFATPSGEMHQPAYQKLLKQRMEVIEKMA